MTTRFSNAASDVAGYEIPGGDYILERDEQWYYWIATSSPFENHGPYETMHAALARYNEIAGSTYTIHDLGDKDIS